MGSTSSGAECKNRYVNSLRRIALGSVVTLGLVSGCSGAQTGPHLGALKASIVQGLPVPKEAQLYRGNASDQSAQYVVPRDVSMNALNQWYERQLPAGRPWRDWAVCHSADLQTSPVGGKVWLWQRNKNQLTQLHLVTIVLSGRLSIQLEVSPPLPADYACH